MFSNSLNVCWQFEIVPLRIICLALYPIFKLDFFWVFCASFLQFFIYFGDQSSVRCGIGKDFFPFCRMSFSLIDCVLCLTEAFQFQEVSFIDCCSQYLCYSCYIYEAVSRAYVFKDTSHLLLYQVQSNWIYVEVIDPLGLEFCVWPKIWIYL